MATQMSATQFVVMVENYLGWRPKGEGPTWKLERKAAAQVKRMIATNPELFTWDNLRIAIALLRREKRAATPLGVFFHVERALEVVADEESDLEMDIRDAMTIEAGRGDPDGWVERFSRAVGIYRGEALAEWQEVHGHAS